MAKLPPINENQVTTYGQTLAEAGAAASTIERKTSAINKFLNWGQQKGYVEAEEQPIIEIPPSQPSSLSEPQVYGKTPPTHHTRNGIFLVLTGATLLFLLLLVTRRDVVIRLLQNFAQEQPSTSTALTSLQPTPEPTIRPSSPTPTSLPSPTPSPSQPASPSGSIVATDNQGIISRMGPIKIEGTSLTLATAPFSNGNITLAPDAEGQLLIRSSTTSKNSIDIRNANLTTGDLIHANVGNTNTNYNFLRFTNGPDEKLHFQVDANGNMYVGGTATVDKKLLVDEIGSQTTGGPITFDNNLSFNGAGTITTTNGNLTLSPTSGIVNIPVSIQNLSTTNDGRVQIDDTTQINGQLNTRGISAHGFVQIDNGLEVTAGDLTVDSLNTSGAIVYATASGVFKVTAAGTTGQCLVSGGSGTPTWGSCGGASYWNLTNGALYPVNATVDTLIGGTSTASAKFAFINVASGTPTASISGSTANVATSLSGEGTLATTNMAPLTIGSATTGPIQLSPKGTTGLFVDRAGDVGIGNTAPSVALDVTGNIKVSGTTNFGGIAYTWPGSQSTNYLLQTNGTGTLSWTDPNLAAASTIFWNQNNGLLFPKNSTVDVTIGGQSTASAKFAFINVASGTPTASVAGNLTLDSTGVIQTTKNQALTIGGDSTGNITLSPLNGSGTVSLSNFTTAGAVVYSTNTSGTLGITAQGTTNQCLISGGSGTPTWTSCSSASGATNYWRLLSGALSPVNDSLDLLIGNSATTSAKFAFINVASGTPTASISGSTANVATSLSGEGTLATTNMAPLTIGSSVTGPIQLSPKGTTGLFVNGAGFVGINTLTPRVLQDNLSTTTQLRLSYTDNAIYANFTVGANGDLTIAPTGGASTNVVTGGDIQVNGNDIRDSGGTARLTVGTTNSITGRLSVANNSQAALGQALTVLDQYEQQDILAASASGVPRAAIERTGDYKMFGPKTQVTIANINDLFLYDTTADSDGGQWTNGDKAVSSSWYTETIDNGAAACVIGTDDRCGKKEFPKRATIIAANDNLYIYDNTTNTMWIRFTQGTNFALGAAANNQLSTVYALNGKVYVGTNGSSATGLYVIDFKADTIRRYDTTSQGKSDQRISSRNTTNTYVTESTKLKLPSNVVNDVNAATINSSFANLPVPPHSGSPYDYYANDLQALNRDYVAVGTNGGTTGTVVLLQENDTQMGIFGINDTAIVSNRVFLTSEGTLYYTYRDQNSNANDKLKVLYNAITKLSYDPLQRITTTASASASIVYGNKSTTNYGVAFKDSYDAITSFIPGPTFPVTTMVINDLFVTRGTSTADGKGNTIYIADNANGLVVLNENRSDETRGSAKYYTKDYITEEMVGDARGVWTLKDANDISPRANNLTNNGSVTFTASGVRGKTATFAAGSSQYLSSTSTSLNHLSGITVGAWVNPTSITGKQIILAKSGDTARMSYKLYLNSGIPTFVVSDNGSTTYSVAGPSALSSSTWYHIAAVYNPSQSLDLYVNGNLVARTHNSPLSLYQTPVDFMLGNDDQIHANATGTLDSTGKIITMTTPANPTNYFSVGDFINALNVTDTVATQTVVTAVSSTTVTVLDAIGTSTYTGNTVRFSRINNEAPFAGKALDATFKIITGPDATKFSVGDLVEVYNSTASTKTQTVVTATSETTITVNDAVGTATTHATRVAKINSTVPIGALTVDATGRVLSDGPNNVTFSPGDFVNVYDYVGTVKSTSTVATASGATSVTMLDFVANATTDDTWTVKLNKYAPISGTALNATFKVITGPNNTQFSVGDLVEVFNSSTAPVRKTQTTVTATAATTITVIDAVGTATTDQTKVVKINVTSTPTEFLDAKLDEVFMTAISLMPSQVQRMYEIGRRSLQHHTASEIAGVTGADTYQQLAGAGTAGATVNRVTAVAADVRNQRLFVGTNDSTTNTGSISVVGLTADSLIDLYDDTNNTSKKDDTGTQFAGTDSVSISLAGTEPRYVAFAGTNDTTTSVWLENSDTSLQSFMSNTVNPHGPTLNQTNLRITGGLFLGQDTGQQAILEPGGDGAQFTGNLAVKGNVTIQGQLTADTRSDFKAKQLVSNNDEGLYTSMKLGPDDLPRIVFYDNTLKQLKYLRCMNVTCDQYYITILDDGGRANLDVGQYASLALGPDKLPRVVYHDNTTKRLLFIRCLDDNCTKRNRAVVDGESNGTNGVGTYASLAVRSDGTAAIAYQDVANTDMKYASCQNLDCTSVTITTIESISATYTSIALKSDDTAYVAYYDSSGGDAELANCSDRDCNVFTIQTVESTNVIGQYIKVKVDATDGFPRLAYYDTTNTNPRYIQCTNASCSTKNLSGVDVNAGTSVGTFVDFIQDATGAATLSYNDATNGTLKVAQCSTLSCSFATLTTVDNPTDTVGQYTSIDTGTDGFARIAHYDYQAATLGIRYVECTNATCSTSTSGTPANIYSYYSLGTSTHLRANAFAIGLDNNIRAVFYDSTNLDLKYLWCLDSDCNGVMVNTLDSTGTVGNYNSIAIGTDGFARIAYYDTTNTALKYIQCLDDGCFTRNVTTVATSIDNNSGTPYTDVGVSPKIVIGKDGLARIAHTSATQDYFFTRCLNDACTESTRRLIRDYSGSVTNYVWADMILDQNDFPAMMLNHRADDGTTSTQNLYYVHCTDMDCYGDDDDWSLGAVTETTGLANYFRSPKLGINAATGLPFISTMRSASSQNIYFCSNWANCTIIETSKSATGNTVNAGGKYDRNGKQLIFASNNTSGDFILNRCDDSLCSNITTTTGYKVNVSNLTGLSYLHGDMDLRYYGSRTDAVFLYNISAALTYVVDSGINFNIGSGDKPFSAVFTQKLLARTATVDAMDLAEEYPSSEVLGAGDVVSFDESSGGSVRKSTKSYDGKIAGVVSTNPGMLLTNSGQKGSVYPIALAGHVPVNMDQTSEPVAIGDFLTSSDKPGLAKKATQAGYTIGKALENWNCNSSTSEVKSSDTSEVSLGGTCPDRTEVFVKPGFWEPDATLTSRGDIHIEKDLAASSSSTATDSGSLTQELYKVVRTTADGGKEIIDRFGAFSELMAGNLQAGQVQLDTISPLASDSAGIAVRLGPTQTFGIYNKEGTPAATFDTQGNATLAGTLRAAKIHLEGENNFSHLRGDTALEVTGDASISGTLYADRIVTHFGEIGELKTTTVSATYITNVTNIFDATPSSQLAIDSTSSALLALGIQPDTNNQTLSISKPITLVSNFNVLGDTTLGRTTIAGSLLIDGSIRLAASGIETIADTLYIQKSRFAAVDIGNGALLVNTSGNVFMNGNLTVRGTLATGVISPIGTNDLTIDLSAGTNSSTSGVKSADTPEVSRASGSLAGGFGRFIIKGPGNLLAAAIDASGNATFSGELTTSRLIIAEGSGAPATQSAQATSNAIIGTAMLPAGNLTVTISTTKVTKNSYVYITPITSTLNTVLYVKSKVEGTGFIVAVDQPIPNAVQFNWWIVN